MIFIETEDFLSKIQKLYSEDENKGNMEGTINNLFENLKRTLSGGIDDIIEIKEENTVKEIKNALATIASYLT